MFWLRNKKIIFLLLILNLSPETVIDTALKLDYLIEDDEWITWLTFKEFRKIHEYRVMALV